jgi:DNA polymerase-3 subunit alpha
LYVTVFRRGKCWFIEDGLLGLKPDADKDTVKLVKYRTGIDLDPDAFQLMMLRRMSFSTGRNGRIFSMKVQECKSMKELKPTVFPI